MYLPRLPAFALGLATSLLACADGARPGSLPRDDDPVPRELRAAGEHVAVRFDARGRLRWVTGRLPTVGATVEAAARGFLVDHADLFEVQRDGSDLVLDRVRRGRATSYVRFAQHVGGLPIFDRAVVVGLGEASGTPMITSLHLAHAGLVTPPVDAPDRGAAAAIAAAMAGAGPTGGGVTEPATKGYFAPRSGAPLQLAYRVRLAATEVGVDAATGATLWRKARRVTADGTGLVFDPDPVASTGNPGLTDDNDADSPALDAARFAVTLPRLDGSGVLRGPWADARSSNAAQRATEAGLDFSYPRSDDRFEEVMAYYHLDRAQARVQALGFTAVNNRVQEAVANAFAADNSFYSSTTKRLEFGRGGVDDGEDGDIILHEYGHSIHDDQVPGWGGGDERSMGEGFGDYFAGSFQGTLGRGVGDPACVGDWDAVAYDTRSPPCLRRLDEPKHWPEDAVGQVHADGELWSGALWRARTVVGADVMDRLVLESHFLLSTSATFQEGADAILAVDADLHAGANLETLRRAFFAHGLSRDAVSGPRYESVERSEDVDLHNPRGGGGTYANRLDHEVTYSVPGAAALRLHFDELETEVDASCLDNACDNVYLFDGQGDLFQVLHGARSNFDSVQIPGDTVTIRLVTDGSIGAFGYQVSRVDVMGGAMLPDAAPGTPDAAWNGPDAAAGADGGTDGGTGGPSDEGAASGGCCSTTGAGDHAATGFVGAGLLAAVLRRRRRRPAR
jgi:MYXO-CTERM domain-containing protein